MSDPTPTPTPFRPASTARGVLRHWGSVTMELAQSSVLGCYLYLLRRQQTASASRGRS